MDACYFKDQICDEIEGARAYIKHAIEIKAMNPAWSKMFVEMSSAELEHVKNLYKMFDEYYQKLRGTYSTMPDYIEDARACIMHMYTEDFAQIKYLHELYLK